MPWLKIGLVAGLLAALGMIAWGLHHAGYSAGHADADAAWQKTWDAHVQADTQATLAEEVKQRDIEQQRQQSITKVAQDAQQKINSAEADRLVAEQRSSSLQRAADDRAKRAASLQAGLNTCTAGASEAATESARVLADVLKRADTRAGILAGIADQAIERGLACQSAYSGLTSSAQ